MSDATTIPEIRSEAVREFIASLTHAIVLAVDHGCDGHTPPLQVFLDEKQARAALALASATYASVAAYRVPLWPHPATDKPQPLE